MRPFAFVLAVAVRLACVAAPASAQSVSEFVAWNALMRSPLGGTLAAPAEFRSSDPARSAIALSYGAWRFAPGDDETSNFAATVQYPLGRVLVVINGMQTEVKDCSDCGGYAIGGGVLVGLLSLRPGGDESSGLDIAFQPMVNFGSWGDGDVSATTAAVSFPMSATMPLGPIALRPFVSPGFGYGRASAASDSYAALKPLIGYGIAIANRSGSVQFHIGTMEVRLRDAPTVTSSGLTFRF